MSTTLKITDVFDLLYPPLHFAVSKHIEEDDIYRIKAQTIGFVKYPQFILFHPGKLQEMAEGLPMRLIPIREREPEYKIIEYDKTALYDLLLSDYLIDNKSNLLPPGACS